MATIKRQAIIIDEGRDGGDPCLLPGPDRWRNLLIPPDFPEHKRIAALFPIEVYQSHDKKPDVI
jgi:hypothetical protein